MSFPMRSRLFSIPILLVVSSVIFAATGFGVQSATAKAKDNQVTLASYELTGTVNIPTGAQFEGTEVGGLSSIAYDSKRCSGCIQNCGHGQKADVTGIQLTIRNIDIQCVISHWIDRALVV